MDYIGAILCASLFCSFFRDLHSSRIRVFPYYDRPLQADTYLHGYALARNWGHLEELARAQQFAPLSCFGFDDPLRGEERHWWSASDGLTSVKGLLKLIRSTPDYVDDPVAVCSDVERVEQALKMAVKEDARFALLVAASDSTNYLAWEIREGYP